MSEEFEQMNRLGGEDDGSAVESGRTVSKRRGWFMALVALVAVLVVAGAALIIGGSQGGSAGAGAAPSVSYSPAPVVTAPFGPSSPDTYTAPALAPDVVPSGPSTVSIPSIGVSTKFEAKGLLPGKVLDLPADKAAWYDQSAPVSAAEGSTVISGHVNTITNGKGPLGGLADVQKGAPVTITDADGTVHAYKIASLSTVDKDKLDVAWFNPPKNERTVVFITCGGEVQGYNQYGLPEYEKNTVAVAVPVDQ